MSEVSETKAPLLTGDARDFADLVEKLLDLGWKAETLIDIVRELSESEAGHNE